MTLRHVCLISTRHVDISLNLIFLAAGVLIIALNLEYLENDFYRTALGKFSQEDFNKAGYPPWVRNRFEQIAEHEKTHVDFLVSALSAAGAPVPQPCEYGL